MYAPEHLRHDDERPCLIMAASGETRSFAAVEARANRIAHLLRFCGLARGDHFAIFMENRAEYIEVCAAGERSGLYSTSVNSHLTADELGYILTDCDARILITSPAKLPVAQEAVKRCPNPPRLLVAGGEGRDEGSGSLELAARGFPSTPLPDESAGLAMLYSSGTTGRPKGILRPLPEGSPGTLTPVLEFLNGIGRYRPGMTYLCPAPLYHAAPQGAVGLTMRSGGTSIIMERFDPEHFLALVEKYRVTHTQLVPTMFARMLKLPAATRQKFDLSSLEYVLHAGAPCPQTIKAAMIDWWGPIVHEYYGATEGHGLTFCSAAEWLEHRGSVGRAVLGSIVVRGDNGTELAAGVPGAIWFRGGAPFVYHNDPLKTAEARIGDMATVGDVGYVDEEGFLYLTDRAAFVIISGGVNIYPQECEDILISHPCVADAAVFGVPNEDLGEEVKAVVQLLDGVPATDATKQELLEHCRSHIAHFKCPRSIDFRESLPRLPTGKLYKRELRDEYLRSAEMDA